DMRLGRSLKVVGRPLADWLRSGRLEPISQPNDCCLVFYFKSMTWCHAGRLVSADRVNSQWGVFPAYEHGMWEVPLSYGDEIRCYQMPAEREVVRLFLEFGSNGGPLGKIPCSKD